MEKSNYTNDSNLLQSLFVHQLVSNESQPVTHTWAENVGQIIGPEKWHDGICV